MEVMLNILNRMVKKLRLKIITPPATEPITLAEAKNHLRISGADDDTLIARLITHTREWCEDYQGKKYITQTLEAYLDEFPYGSIEFRDCSPVQSVTSIIYTDKDGLVTTLDVVNYSLDNVSFVNKIDLNYNKTWPAVTLKSTNGIVIRFVAGAATVPETVKWAMVLQMKLLYDDYRPDERAGLERARDALLGMNRVMNL